jgi:hypothetical protein
VTVARRRLLAPALFLVALAACGPGGVDALPPPPTTRPLPDQTTTTTAPSTAGVELPSVSGRTRTTVDLGPGAARLSGAVRGPDGPVPGATVHVERLVGDASAAVDVRSGPDGRWVVAGVLGGRYRVRAWRSPDLAQLDPEIVFVGATEAKQLDLVLGRHTDVTTASSLAPNPPVVGQLAHLAVGVNRRLVDDRGVVRSAPMPRVPIQLFGPGQWQVVTPNPGLTDAAGSADWYVVCRAPGPQPLSVAVAGLQFPLTLPACVG